MTYSVFVTKRADKLLDNIIHYFIYQLNSTHAARHLLDEIENVYNRLEENPYQFPICRDTYLANKGYREAKVPRMYFVIIFNIIVNVVNVVGIFHQLEDYKEKL